MANLKDLLVNGVTRFIGKVYAPTPETGDNSTQVATTAFVMENAGTSSYHPTLFDFKYSDKLVNDIQWLRGDTFSWQTGGTNGVYKAAYAKLLEEYNDSSSTTVTEGTVTYKLTPSGFKIADSTQENAIVTLYNTTGIAWYYIIDTTNSRFKLPRSKYRAFKGSTMPVKGNGVTLGVTNGANNYGVQEWITQGQYMLATQEVYGKSVGTSNSSSSSIATALLSLGVTTDSSKSGIVVDTEEGTEEPWKYLYFYVGEYTQTAIQQTAGLNAELFNNKLDLNMANANPTSAIKNTFSTFGLPDYSAAVSQSATTEYTATTNGYIHCFNFTTTNLTLTINSVTYYWASGGGGNIITGANFMMPVSKGDKYKLNEAFSSTSNCFLNFYPLKGAT